MKKTKKTLTAVLVVLAWIAISVSLWPAVAEQPGRQTTEAKPDGKESLEVRLARTHVELANLHVQWALDANQELPNVYSAEFIEKLRFHAEADKAQLEQCLKMEKVDPHQVCICRAKAAVKIAEADLARMRALHQRMPTDATAWRLERADVMARMAKIHLERIQQLEDGDSVIAHLQMQIDDLRHQVLELKILPGHRR